MMSASTGFSISGTQTSAPVAFAIGATAPTWSKCVCVSRIPLRSSPRPSIALSSFGASSPGSTMSASVAPSRRNRKQFSCTGPTVNMRTSMACRLSLLSPLVPAVEEQVHVVRHGQVDRDHHEHQQEAGGDRLAEREDHDDPEEQRGDPGAVEGAPPGG